MLHQDPSRPFFLLAFQLQNNCDHPHLKASHKSQLNTSHSSSHLMTLVGISLLIYHHQPYTSVSKYQHGDETRGEHI